MAERWQRLLLLLGVLGILTLAHVVGYRTSEPFFNGDETRHVMTGVFFHDFYRDFPIQGAREYTVRYYLQYPALGLLVWPPFFYAVEGVFMLAFGTSFLAARVLIGLFAALACVYLFLLVLRTHDRFTAVLVTLLFGTAPLMVSFSRQVMLEVPTLACALAALYHFVAYLDDRRRRDLWLCALATACTALTRFDGIFLAPLFLILLIARHQLGVLRRLEVIGAVLAAVLVVLPFYLVTTAEFGWVHSMSVGEGLDGPALGLLGVLAYYPACVPGQIGWFALVPALLGLGAAVVTSRRTRCWPYLALVLATYLTFTPLGDRGPRHTIYWVPALALFATEGIGLLATAFAQRLSPLAASRAGSVSDGQEPEASARETLSVADASGSWGLAATDKASVAHASGSWGLAALVLLGTGWLAWTIPAPYVRGYEDAARYVVSHTQRSPLCLFDSYLNGDFIFQVRRLDPQRRLWVLRGDKLFYGVVCDPTVAYEELTRTDQEILAVLQHYDPEYIVVEEPQVMYRMPAAERLRTVLREHPERFHLETTIPVKSNNRNFRNVQLAIYRNLVANPDRARRLEVEMLGLRRSIDTTLPGPPEQ